MDLTIVVEGDGHEDELRSLSGWLSEEDELRGRVRLVIRPPEPGTLGSAVELLQVALGPGGALTSLSGALIAWLHHRRSDVVVRATRDGGRVSIEVMAKHVSGLDAAGLRRQVLELERALDGGGEDMAGDGWPSQE